MIGIYHLISRNNKGFSIVRNNVPRCKFEQIDYGSYLNMGVRFDSSSRGGKVYHPAFNENSNLVLRAVRLSMFGGRGLREGMEIDTENTVLPQPAFLSIYTSDNYATKVFDSFSISLEHFDEWKTINKVMAPVGEKKYFRLNSISVNYDSVNIQDIYQDLHVCPQVELMVECAGMYGDFGGGDLL